MKALSMAISSPEILLKQLSRNNAGSRSKSSSPIFYTRRHAAAAAGITAQEPYSPKVTCIGQVRPRKSRRHRRRCWFMKGKFLWRRRRAAFWRSLCKWVVFLKAGYCKKVDAEDDCFSVGRKIEFLGENSDHVEIRVGDSCCSPPRNALMLTRFSRSAPYRASSLGERIRRERIIEESSAAEGLINDNEVQQQQAESRIGQENGGVSENPRNTTNIAGDLEGIISVVLTRSKSEPPRTRTGDSF